MTSDAETLDTALGEPAGRRAGVSDGMLDLLDLAAEVGRVLDRRSLTDGERRLLYMRATAIIEAGLLPGRGWAERVYDHRRAVLGGTVAALAAATVLGLVMHERRGHRPLTKSLRVAA